MSFGPKRCGPSGLATPIFSLSSLEPKSLRMIILTIILVQVLCCLYQSPKHYIEIWHERPFSLHQPLAWEMSQTAIGDQSHLAMCHLRGSGARGPPPLGQATWRSADRGLALFASVFGQKTTRWAPMSCIWVRACLKSVR